MNMTRATTHWGDMWFPIEDIAIGPLLEKHGVYSPAELDLILLHSAPGKILLDVGAHVGSFAVPAALEGAEVYAFEYHPDLYRCLEKNVMAHKLSSMTIVNAAVGAENTTCKTQPLKIEGPINTGASHVTVSETGDTLTRCITLDSMTLTHCDFIKIDVEGMESEVLEGARNTIQTHKPRCYVEIHDDEQMEKCCTFFRRMNYQIMTHNPPYTPASDKSNLRNYGSCCLFALHREDELDEALIEHVERTQVTLTIL